MVRFYCTIKAGAGLRQIERDVLASGVEFKDTSAPCNEFRLSYVYSDFHLLQ